VKQVKTADNSVTFFNEDVKEFYHAVNIGAVKEAMVKFVKPCKIAEKAKTGSLVILDVCFGLGYNSAAAIDIALEANPNCKIRVIGLEQDIKIITAIHTLYPPLKNYHLLRKLEKKRLTVSSKNVAVTVLLGDARETIYDVGLKVDAIFFDPFSPKKQPELWTALLFNAIKQRMKNDAILATYSCARIVRENMIRAGFKVKDSVPIGRRGPGTIGLLK
jgi:tRNA U34 5-methylaminomethyl-2-thiouridine-forming methyltransferase MnmC